MYWATPEREQPHLDEHPDDRNDADRDERAQHVSAKPTRDPFRREQDKRRGAEEARRDHQLARVQDRPAHHVPQRVLPRLEPLVRAEAARQAAGGSRASRRGRGRPGRARSRPRRRRWSARRRSSSRGTPARQSRPSFRSAAPHEHGQQNEVLVARDARQADRAERENLARDGRPLERERGQRRARARRSGTRCSPSSRVRRTRTPACRARARPRRATSRTTQAAASTGRPGPRPAT